MRLTTILARSAATLAVLLGTTGVVARTQHRVYLRAGSAQLQTTIPAGQHVPGLPGAHDREQDPLARSVEEKQSKARNDERQRRLEADTDKLLTLATQLHDDVAKTNKNVLSLDVVRRAQEIEKLAHDVKERMKG